MKKLLSILVVATLVATFPAASFAKKAAASSPAPGATPAAAAKPIPLYSEVTTIDAAKKTWTHKNKDGKEVTFHVTATTDIKQAGAAAKFEDIKVGDWVSGLRKKTGDNDYDVIKITKFGPKAEKAAAATPTPAAATPAAGGKSKKGAN